MRVLIVDGYDRPAREELKQAGASLAGSLYRALLLRHLPEAIADIMTPADPDCSIKGGFEGYAAALWTGSSLTAYENIPAVTRQIELVRQVMEAGIPCFGSCWALQIAALAAGGSVHKNPKGREFGVARNITLTDQGRADPIFSGRKYAFDGFSSHFDAVDRLPDGATRLAGNDHTPVQAARIIYARSEFLALQYHPEYNMQEIAALARFRADGLVQEGRFTSRETLERTALDWNALHSAPETLALSWLYGMSRDVLIPDLREQEFARWIAEIVAS